ncbi:Uncharacterized protein FKW44_019807 [Caligus rogercresseyi]|uniref:Uncharacterized protein n=1 Tax=Caligus rogercresseyi TaxID=217165 RepID=A0A7T8GWC3_CALRO|nr:Uncharacterized protein FKW44_019807 [Caligus rogercresseyi]
MKEASSSPSIPLRLVPIPGSSDADDIPIDRESLPQGIKDQLEEGELIDEIVIEDEDGKQVVEVKEEGLQEDEEEEAIMVPLSSNDGDLLIQDLLAEAKKENPRSGRKAVNIQEEDRQSQLTDDLSREDLIKLLAKSQNLRDTLPSNRPASFRSASTRQITLVGNDDDLPGKDQGNGTRCETKYERGMRCQHVLKDKCHMTYVTDYHPVPEEKCETLFKKRCYITFKAPHTETFERCHTPFEKKCGDDVKGPEVCKVVNEDYCETVYKEYTVDEQYPDCVVKEKPNCIEKDFDIFNLPKTESTSNKTYAKKKICESGLSSRAQ